MKERDFLDALIAASKVEDVRNAVSDFKAANGTSITEVPFGGRPNNRGAIEVATDPARSAIERVTNAHDAILELENEKHKAKHDYRSPREAAHAWLGVPIEGGLSKLSQTQRQVLARKTILRLEPGEGWQSRVVTVVDEGIGIHPDRLHETILSLNESNKIQKHFLAGTYGQGGSSTLAFCKFAIIISRAYGSDDVGFTVVRYEDLPADEYKTGRYVYLVQDGKPVVCKATAKDHPHGTIIRHFGYDLTGYTGALGPNSMYGALQRILFDPVAPIFYENRIQISEKRPTGVNRVIKGVRNALNGAVDQDDDKGPDLDYHSPMFNVSLGDLGDIGIEYWVLAQPAPEKDKKAKIPTSAFIDPRKPIILTHNGQNQGEMSALLIRKDADLPYLRYRIICHINTDRLSPESKRKLFSSTREQSREGFTLKKIQEELIRALKADDELTRLNEEARERSLRDQDESVKQEMRKQVAKLLRIAGAALQEVEGGKTKGVGEGRPIHKRTRAKPEPITPVDPPTYLRIVWDKDKDIPLFPGQRRYVRLETDANSTYGDKINVVLGDDLTLFGKSPLQGGRMRVGIECKQEVMRGAQGSMRVELYRPGLQALAAEKAYIIVDPPKPKEEQHQATVPDFNVIEVSGPEDENWEYVCDNMEDDSVSRHASGAEMNAGVLDVYFSAAFPRYRTELKRFEQSEPALAASFKERYKLWIAVHALLMEQSKKDEDTENLSEDAVKELNRQERCRLASIAAMVAAQEVRTGVKTEEVEAA